MAAAFWRAGPFEAGTANDGRQALGEVGPSQISGKPDPQSESRRLRKKSVLICVHPRSSACQMVVPCYQWGQLSSSWVAAPCQIKIAHETRQYVFPWQVRKRPRQQFYWPNLIRRGTACDLQRSQTNQQ